MADKRGMSGEEISLKDVFLKLNEWIFYLVGRWKWILLFMIVGIVLGLTYAFFKNPVYTAKITFVTESKQGSSAFSSYAGLASQFGINIGSTGVSSDLFNSNNIFDLMTTRLILQETLLTPVIVNGKQTLFINWYISVEQKLKKKHPTWEKISFDPSGSDSLNQTQNRVIKFVCDDIGNRLTSSKGSIMSVSFTSSNELFAQEFLKTLIQNVGQFYIATKTKMARDNITVLQKQIDSVKNQLFGAMGSVASFEDFNLNLVRQEPRVQQQKSSIKVSINSAIYQQLVTGLEAAKMTLLKETPLFEIIDEPILPLDEKKPGKVKWGFAGGLLGIFLSGGWFLLRKIYKEIMAS